MYAYDVSTRRQTNLFKIAILITNQVQCELRLSTSSMIYINQDGIADPGATMTFVAGGALKPIGGHIMSHASATRIFLRKGRSFTGKGPVSPR